jgi:hypothetical protein
MRTLTLAAAALFAAAARAEEPKLPAIAVPPQTAHATAATKGGKVTVTLKLLVVAPATAYETVNEQVTRTVDGKTVVETVTKKVPYTFMKGHGWREVRVNAADKAVSVRDAAGRPVPADKLTKLLEKDTPVLVSVNGPVDPFYLLTVKEDTLVIVVPPRLLAGPPPAPTGPGAGAVVPPAPGK